MPTIIQDSLSLVLAGEAGQGIQSIEAVLVGLLKHSGWNVFATKEYMSRVRGGVSTTEIRISSRPQPVFTDRIDILIPLSPTSLPHLSRRIGPATLAVGDRTKVGKDAPEGLRWIDLPFTQVAAEAGSALMANTVAAGVVAGLLGVDRTLAADFIARFFAKKPLDIQEKNRAVLLLGMDRGAALTSEIEVRVAKDPRVPGQIVLTGNEAVALGAVAGGVNYICSYPMSPGTPVMELLAEYSKTFDILVEQVEDEVGVVNMALGAWYAGARTLVTTSGGGFALMTEGVSLAGIAEIPLVVHIAQRPGPATGLPTRTEQGDLFLAAFAGHGEFARIVLAPGDLQEAYALSRAAVEWADRFQTPVFLLTDQYLLESASNTDPFEVGPAPVDHVVGRTGPDYRRFAITEDGISPRGLPGFGTGIVNVDSDEHDEAGYITESMEVRDAMTARRLRKIETIREAMPAPEWIGPADAETLVVGWGSTKDILRAALEELNLPGVAQVHFSWVWPLPASAEPLLRRAKRLILVENNEVGHLGKLIRMETGIAFPHKLLKSNGLPFSLEEVKEGLLRLVNP